MEPWGFKTFCHKLGIPCFQINPNFRASQQESLLGSVSLMPLDIRVSRCLAPVIFWMAQALCQKYPWGSTMINIYSPACQWFSPGLLGFWPRRSESPFVRLRIAVKQQVQDPRHCSKECVLAHISKITLHYEPLFQAASRLLVLRSSLSHAKSGGGRTSPSPQENCKHPFSGCWLQMFSVQRYSQWQGPISNMGLSENRVYSQWSSHLIGIMISKTIGFRGTLFSDTPISTIWFFKNFQGMTTQQISPDLSAHLPAESRSGRSRSVWPLRISMRMAWGHSDICRWLGIPFFSRALTSLTMINHHWQSLTIINNH